MSHSNSKDGFASDSSGQLDLLSVKHNLQSASDDVTLSDAPGKVKVISDALQTTNSDEPAWVLDHSQSRPTDGENRRRMLASLSEEEEDSIIDLVSQEPDFEANKEAFNEENGVVDQSSAQKPPKSQKTHHGPKSSLPLTVAPKVDDSLVLLQSSDGNLDLSGDVGAVGRVKVSDDGLFFDIKGVVYRVTTHATNTACVVQMDDDEARVTSVMDEVLTLHMDRNLFTSDEIIINGNLDDQSEHGSLFEEDRGGSEVPQKGKRKQRPSSGGSKAGPT